MILTKFKGREFYPSNQSTLVQAEEERNHTLLTLPQLTFASCIYFALKVR